MARDKRRIGFVNDGKWNASIYGRCHYYAFVQSQLIRIVLSVRALQEALLNGTLERSLCVFIGTVVWLVDRLHATKFKH